MWRTLSAQVRGQGGTAQSAVHPSHLHSEELPAASSQQRGRAELSISSYQENGQPISLLPNIQIKNREAARKRKQWGGWRWWEQRKGGSNQPLLSCPDCDQDEADLDEMYSDRLGTSPESGKQLE